MNKIKQILIGAAALTLSANAAAIPMEDGSAYDDISSLIQEVIAGDYNDSWRNERRAARVARKQGLIETGELKLAAEDTRWRKKQRVSQRVNRLQTQIVTVISRMNISAQLPDSIASEINGGNGNGNGNGSVPEPSTIALLGLGLVGIGVARRMRKKA
jgi:hypothetical protein